MSISAQEAAHLRAQTGAGILEARQALKEAGGDQKKAVEILRKKGSIQAAKKADRVTNEGRVHAYVHGGAKMGVLIEVLCETDFVARTEAFIALCNDLAMQIAAADPQYVRREDVPEAFLEERRALERRILASEKKPSDLVEKILEGKMNRFFSEICLLEQAFVKDDSKTIEMLLNEKRNAMGENLQVRRFVRFVLGE
jgi:elongation factor Ts